MKGKKRVTDADADADANASAGADRPAWLRRGGESAEAFRAFCIYRDLGAGRSIDAAYAKQKGQQQKRNKRATGTWTAWSGAHDWPARAQAFDDHNEEVAQAARQRALAAESAKWEKRRQAQRERDYALGEGLQKTARELLKDLPAARAGDVPRMAEAGSKLARLAAGMETDSTRVHVSGGAAGSDIDLTDKSDDELITYFDGLAKAAGVLIELARPS